MNSGIGTVYYHGKSDISSGYLSFSYFDGYKRIGVGVYGSKVCQSLPNDW